MYFIFMFFKADFSKMKVEKSAIKNILHFYLIVLTHSNTHTKIVKIFFPPELEMKWCFQSLHVTKTLFSDSILIITHEQLSLNHY